MVSFSCESCVSEAQKYQGALFKEKPTKQLKKTVKINPTSSSLVPRKAYVEDALDGDSENAIAIVEAPPEAPTPPPAVSAKNTQPVNVFDFLVNEDTPNASKVSLGGSHAQMEMKPHAPPLFEANRQSSSDSGTDHEYDSAYERHGYTYGTDPVPSVSTLKRLEYETPAPKSTSHQNLSRDSHIYELDGAERKSTDKKRKRTPIEELDLTAARPSSRQQSADAVMLEAPTPLLAHSGLTGGLNRLLSTKSVGGKLPPSPEYSTSNSQQQNPSPPSPVRRKKRVITTFDGERVRKTESGALVRVRKAPSSRRASDESVRPRKQHRLLKEDGEHRDRTARPSLLQFNTHAFAHSTPWQLVVLLLDDDVDVDVLLRDVEGGGVIVGEFVVGEVVGEVVGVLVDDDEVDGEIETEDAVEIAVGRKDEADADAAVEPAFPPPPPRLRQRRSVQPAAVLDVLDELDNNEEIVEDGAMVVGRLLDAELPVPLLLIEDALIMELDVEPSPLPPRPKLRHSSPEQLEVDGCSDAEDAAEDAVAAVVLVGVKIEVAVDRILPETVAVPTEILAQTNPLHELVRADEASAAVDVVDAGAPFPPPPRPSERHRSPEQEEAEGDTTVAKVVGMDVDDVIEPGKVLTRSVHDEVDDAVLDVLLPLDVWVGVTDALDEPPNPTERQSSPEQEEVGLALPETLSIEAVVEIPDCEIVASDDEVVVGPSRFNEALTQSRFVHPYGRVDVGVLEVAVVVVGTVGVRGPAAEVELDSVLREALTHRRFVQPKGKLVVEGVGAEVLGPEDSEVGLTEMLRQRRPVQLVVELPAPVILDDKGVEPEVNGKVREPVLETRGCPGEPQAWSLVLEHGVRHWEGSADEAAIDKPPQQQLTQASPEHEVEADIGPVDVAGTDGKVPVDEKVIDDAVLVRETVQPPRFKHAFTQRRSVHVVVTAGPLRLVVGRLVVGRFVVPVKVGLEVVETGGNAEDTDVLPELVVPGCSVLLEGDVVLVRETVQPLRFKQALTHSKSVQVVVEATVGELVLAVTGTPVTGGLVVPTLVKDELEVVVVLDKDNVHREPRSKHAFTHASSVQVVVGRTEELVVLTLDNAVTVGKVVDGDKPGRDGNDELVAKIVLDPEVLLVSDTVQPKPRLRQALTHDRSVQVADGAELLVARFNVVKGLLVEMNDPDDDILVNWRVDALLVAKPDVVVRDIGNGEVVAEAVWLEDVDGVTLHVLPVQMLRHAGPTQELDDAAVLVPKTEVLVLDNVILVGVEVIGEDV
ncbi:MAG: hypothetical protein Q9209_005843 [Squamulea sp. 1 TL-2023]